MKRSNYLLMSRESREGDELGFWGHISEVSIGKGKYPLTCRSITMQRSRIIHSFVCC